ncbi:MAG: PKD domain-containing protein [Verrucomicrobiia bacterium]
MVTKKVVLAGVALFICAGVVRAQTIMTNTFAEVNLMASLWEVDSLQISPLANAQYPSIGGGTNLWQFLFPSGSINSDGDEDIEMAINSSGTGKTGSNSGYSPIHTEVINVTSAQVSHLNTLNTDQGRTHGIFRFYTEHQGERQYEIHPITEVDTWNAGSGTFVFDSDYHANITNDAYALTESTTYEKELFNGFDRMIATVLSDGSHLMFTWVSPNINYSQWQGIAMSGLTNDFVSSFFWFQPTSPMPSNVPVTVRCRIITNTYAARLASGLVSNQAVTVNALNRTDMLMVSNNIAGMTAGQTTNVPAAYELVTLGLSSLGSVGPPSALFSGSPTNGSAPLTVTFADTSTGSITNRFWSFGDGGTTNTTATSVQYVYQTTGSNQVSLIVSGLGGSNTNTKPNYIVVRSATPPPPVASFTNNPASGPAPLTVYFYDTSTGSPTGWAWAFGDGNTSSSQNPSDIYVNPGSYTVQEIVTGNGESSTDTVVNLISVYDPFAWWQRGYGLTNNCALCGPNASYTGDGMSNTNKFMAGFNATNGAAYLHIISIAEQLVAGNTNVVVTYLGANGDNSYMPGIASRTNVLDYTTGDAIGDYTNGGWEDTGQTNILSGGNGSGTITSMTDSNVTASPDLYYRVRVLLP